MKIAKTGLLAYLPSPVSKKAVYLKKEFLILVKSWSAPSLIRTTKATATLCTRSSAVPQIPSCRVWGANFQANKNLLSQICNWTESSLSLASADIILILMKSQESLGHVLKIYSTKAENLKEIDEFLDAYDLPKSNQYEKCNLYTY